MSRQLFWTVEPEWAGETVAILGGGPSLTLGQCEAVREAGCRVIAINNAYELAPLAAILYFTDRHWWEWNRKDPAYRRFSGRKVTLENKRITFGGDGGVPPEEPGVLSLANHGDSTQLRGLCWKRDGVHTGASGGFQAASIQDSDLAPAVID